MPAPVCLLAAELARKENIRQVEFIVISGLASGHGFVMHLQKADQRGMKSDIFDVKRRPELRIAAKLGQIAMRGMQRSHAAMPIASHLQHAYLPVIEGE